jgi:hypothetical protein
MLRLGRILVLAAVVSTAGCRTDNSAQSQVSQSDAKTAAVTTQSVTVTSTGVATDSLSGETVIADNFNTAAGIEPTWYGSTGRGGVAPASADPVGAFRMMCSAGQLLKDDPLVYPGQAGASHLHQFFGNAAADANSNYSSLRTSGGTTCGQSSTPINRSAYWMPAMLDGVGNAVKPDYLNLYYKRNPASDPYCSLSNIEHIGQCTDLPNGIRFVFGYNMKTMTGGPTDPNTQDHDAITFQCWASEDGTVGNNGANGYYHSMPEVVAAGCPVGARLMIVAAAPNCWDGQNLDVADHRSHMAMSNGAMYPGQFFRACPTDHPYVIDNVEVQIAFTIDANFVAGKWHLSSDEMVAGTVPGSTWHMDYWEAWSPTVKGTWHQTCINQKLSCAGGDLGNGTYMIGAGIPNGGWTKHQLVSLSSLGITPTPTPAPTTKVCPDGSVILSTQTCPAPAPTTKVCPDGSVILSTQTCPAPAPTTKVCPDGRVILSTQTCPVPTRAPKPGKGGGRKK